MFYCVCDMILNNNIHLTRFIAVDWWAYVAFYMNLQDFCYEPFPISKCLFSYNIRHRRSTLWSVNFPWSMCYEPCIIDVLVYMTYDIHHSTSYASKNLQRFVIIFCIWFELWHLSTPWYFHRVHSVGSINLLHRN